ncbi:MAG: DUF4340 domain-containing protein [Calditrichaceae bacterium]|nr:DUF4340 domain-containing protein [Calditrichaceae bacterium]MBN2707926.1 DUF4340 domain-containing protein [Calditrichaceae bacterium]RQV95363.1 MAG: DUF4340 domain-containing protein [Calditrichota bacterium]
MKKTIIFLCIALALGAYVYFYEIKGGEEREKAKEESEKLFSLEKDSIQSVLIQSFAGHYLLNRTNDGWQIEIPVKTKADESTVNSLLYGITSAKKTRTFNIKAKDKYDYGVGPGGIKLTVTSKSGIRDSVFLGQSSAVGSEIYASKTDTIIHLISSSLKSNADKTLFEWRDKRPLLFQKDEVREITLVNPAGRYTIVKENNEWKISSPVETKAEKSKVDDILNKLYSGRIKAVVSETPDKSGQYRLINPGYRVELSIGPDKTKTGVSFSSLKDNQAYGRDDVRPHIFEVDSAFMKPLKADLYELRYKKVLEFNKDQVDHFNLLYKNQLLTFNKDTTDNWYLAGGEKAKSWKVTGILRKLNDLKVDRFVQEKPVYFMNFGLVNPEGKVEIFIGQNRVAELNIGYTQGDEVFIYNPQMKPLMAIKASNLEELFPKKSDLVEEVKETIAEDAE